MKPSGDGGSFTRAFMETLSCLTLSHPGPSRGKRAEMETTFKITGDYIELIKLLKITGLCDTGGMAQAVTAEGQVSVDGMVELRKRCKIRAGQTVTFAGNTVNVT